MNKKSLIVTLLIQAICFGVIRWLFWTNANQVILAHNTVQEIALTPMPEPTPFLGATYYGSEDIWQVFDHNLPGHTNAFFIPGGNENLFVLHYDGTQHDPVPYTITGTIPDGYGYNGHIGIDYSIEYEPVLASADGHIEFAGWQNTGDHRQGLGLHVEMRHTANEDYTTLYGHLSSLVVQTADDIVIDIANPGGSYRILGIGGNTGHVFGTGDCLPIPQSGPGCGRHLHFEVRLNGRPVNPYGWIGVGDDPWAIYENPPGIFVGATSYDIWATRPAIWGENQYGDDGPALVMPQPQIARVTIDNSNSWPDFSVVGGCWAAPENNSTAVNSEFTWTAVVTETQNCAAKWRVASDSFSPPGDYDVYVHIPEVSDTYLPSLGAGYRIDHNGKQDRAIVVQAVYPNETHEDQWVYIGRYDFVMNGLEQILLSHETTLDGEQDMGHRVLADAIRLSPAFAADVSGTIYLSANNDDDLNVGGLVFQDEDILTYDGATDSWSLYMDGTDVIPGSVDLDAFQLLDDGSILMSFDFATPLGGVGMVDDSDIVQFSPTSLGDETSGTFTFYRTASQLGLNPAIDNHDVDAIAFTPDGRLLISTVGRIGTAPNIFEDEDLLVYESNSSTPSLYFDGSDVELTLSSEDVIGAWVDGESGQIYLSTLGDFITNNGSLSGDGSDIFVCAPTSTGSTTACTFDSSLHWNGSIHQFAHITVDAFAITPGILPPITCNLLPNCNFEQSDGQGGFLYWTASSSPPEAQWSAALGGHTGYMSAHGEVHEFGGYSATLTSQGVIPVTSNTQYRVSFYGRSEGDIAYINQVSIIWFGSLTSDWTLYVPATTNWTQTFYDDGLFRCPPPGATGFQVQLWTYSSGLAPLIDDSHVYVDDILVETQPGPCPLGPVNIDD